MAWSLGIKKVAALGGFVAAGRCAAGVPQLGVRLGPLCGLGRSSSPLTGCQISTQLYLVVLMVSNITWTGLMALPDRRVCRIEGEQPETRQVPA